MSVRVVIFAEWNAARLRATPNYNLITKPCAHVETRRRFDSARDASAHGEHFFKKASV